MNVRLKDSSAASTLRRRAEEKLAEQALDMSGQAADMQRVVHELQVHQIELEMQNEELRNAQQEIEAGLLRYTELYDFAPVGFFTLKRDGAIAQTNLAGANLLGLPRLRLHARRFNAFLNQGSLPIFDNFLTRTFSGNGEETCEVALLSSEKKPALVLYLTAIADPTGQTCRIVAVDISARKRVENDLAASLATINFLDQAINEHAMVAITDQYGKITYANDKLCRVSKYLLEELLGQDYRTIQAGGHPAGFIHDIERVIAQGHVWKGELRNIAKDGSLYWVDTTIVPFLDKTAKPYQYVAIHTDITERKKMEQALHESHAQLRELSAHQTRVKEDERKRIAREIHDELGQNLLALRIDVSMLHARTGQTHPRLNKKASDVLNNIDATVRSVRSIMNELRPATLDLGLQAAIEWQVQEFERRTGIACTLSVDDKSVFTDLDDDRATALFRILQESLSNVIRHAQASQVEITLRREGSRLSLTVADNGVGIRPGCRRKGNFFGLIGIEERVLSLGGEFSIGPTSENEGATLIIHLPTMADNKEPEEKN